MSSNSYWNVIGGHHIQRIVSFIEAANSVANLLKLFWGLIYAEKGAPRFAKCKHLLEYLDTTGGHNSNPYLNVVLFSTPVLTRHLWQVVSYFPAKMSNMCCSIVWYLRTVLFWYKIFECMAGSIVFQFLEGVNEVSLWCFKRLKIFFKVEHYSLSCLNIKIV